ncbi:MAG: DivIVA domain-containing protein [Nocardioidaceae bacterium]
MIWLWVVVLVAVLGTVAILAAGRDDAMGEVYEDRPDRGIPSGRPLTSDDLDVVRFTTAVRGYRMDEVDAFIDRLRADLMARERHEHDRTELRGPDGVSEAEKLGLEPPAHEQPDPKQPDPEQPEVGSSEGQRAPSSDEAR